jgi:hypothetical protein
MRNIATALTRYGASISHFEPADGTNRFMIAEYT